MASSKHPGYYVGQRVTVCINDAGKRFHMNEEGIVLEVGIEYNDYACKVMLDGGYVNGDLRIFYFRDKEVVDADWLWEQFLNMEERGLVYRKIRPDGTTGWLLTEVGKQVKAGVVDART